MVSVQINGREYRQETIADITIMLGRTRVTDPGLPSSCKLTLHTMDATPVAYGDLLTVIDPVYGPRFTGHVTDVEMSHTLEMINGVLTRVAVIPVQAVGALAVWGRNRIGDTPWPQETVAERAARIAALVNEPLIVQGGAALEVIPRDVDSKTAIEVLAQLADGTGGWLFDTPDGVTVLQAVDARRIGNQVMRWTDWGDTRWQDMEGAWQDQNAYSPAFPRPIAPGPEIVIDEPKWVYNAALVNQVTVGYGPENEQNEQASTYAEDAASIAKYKASAVQIHTPLAILGDAIMRAALILERAAIPQWHLTDVAIDLLHIADADAGPYRDLLPGIRCDISGLPNPAPATGFNGVVEGWQETYTANGGTFAHRLMLALSDARWSYAVLSWDGIPPETVWDDIDAPWQDLITDADLEMSLN